MLTSLDPYGSSSTDWTYGSVGFGVRSGCTEAPPAGTPLRFDRHALCDAPGVAPPDRDNLTDGAFILRAYTR